VRGWPEVDRGWKQAFLASVPSAEGRSGSTTQPELTIDTAQEQTISLTAFRRMPWLADWGLVEVRRTLWDEIRVPPAAASLGTSRRFIHYAPCRRRALTGQELLTR
jgi:hypothetical protein